MTSPTPTIDSIPGEIILHIISQLKGKDFCRVAQVSHKFNRSIEQYRELRYSKENFDTLLDKIIDGAVDVVDFLWLARRHPERRYSAWVLNWTSEYGPAEVIKLLLEANSPYSDCISNALDHASAYGCLKVVERLLATNKSCTKWALDMASNCGYIKIVKLLLKANKPCSNLALEWASINGHTEIVRILLKADKPCTKMVFDWASEFGHIEIVKLLLKANKPCTDALIRALKNNYTEIVKLLLAAGEESI